LTTRRIKNFGRNVEFQPTEVYAPQTEHELLLIMARCQGRRIRAVGRLHSWSEAVVADEVMVDLRHLDQVQVEKRGDKRWLTVGAGCQIKRLLAELERQDAGTSPSLGLVTEQTIAGAISTATHGSGRHSMSHYVEEVRVAIYDPDSGQPVIRAIRDGPELRAARCSLGAMGVIVSVSFWCRPQYNIEEHFRRYGTLDEVLAEEDDYPLQQFYLMPWDWSYVVQQRRETAAQRGGWPTLYRWYFFLTFDIGLHLMILTLVRVLRSSRAIRIFFRHLAPQLIVQDWRVVDRSDRMLVMEHELFCHVEMELFVRRSLIPQALETVISLLKHFDGDSAGLGVAAREALKSHGLLPEVDRLVGSYTHHYPICIRRVLPDDALISMTGGMDEPSYAVSLISYALPHRRSSFFAMAAALGKALAAMFDGRPHWGKICPLSPGNLDRLYPKLAQFSRICTAYDSNGAFTNDWIESFATVKSP
jgi:FAD/FMN-containing dehydrogenase